MLIWVYQHDCIMQVTGDPGHRELEDWVQEAAELFPKAIYFYAELVYEPKEGTS